jgi:undecaprenyl diphosphate synthase
MLQSSSSHSLHVAIIMDGNGRWATSRGLPRPAGHRQGLAALRHIVRAAPAMDVRTLTVFGFSSDNWQRPPVEVAALMQLFEAYVLADRTEWVGNGVRLRVIGRRDRLPLGLVAAIEAVEAATRPGDCLTLRIAWDYSSRTEIARAAARAAADLSPADFGSLLGGGDD